MSKCLVTGAAGFIGSHLCEALLARGHDVVGLDSFVPYYPREVKEYNLAELLKNPGFSFHETDMREGVPREIGRGVDVIFHLAAMAGLMRSWSDLALYSSCNILGTQKLLELARDEKIPHFIHVSTSSVYGKEATGAEESVLRPFSPYGITKLAAENLCWAYESNYGVPVTILRYFSVYGPRQRPDMAYNILIRSLLEQTPFTMFGDGEQSRSNTFVSDCVEATILAFEKKQVALGQVFNVGGGEVVTLNEGIHILEELTGKKCIIEKEPARPGDQKHTAACIDKAANILGYRPTVGVKDGLRAQLEWQAKF